MDPTLKDRLEKQMLENVTEVREREAKNGQIKKEMEKWQKKKDALKQERVSLCWKKSKFLNGGRFGQEGKNLFRRRSPFSVLTSLISA